MELVIIGDQKLIVNLLSLRQPFGRSTTKKLAMEKQMEYYYFGLEDTNVKKMIDNVIKSIECD